jgi:hypothetical protein
LSYTVLHHSRPQPSADQAQHAPVADPVFNKPHHPVVADVVEKPGDVGVQYPVHRPVPNTDRERVQRIVLSPAGPKPIGEADKAGESLEHHAVWRMTVSR